MTLVVLNPHDDLEVDLGEITTTEPQCVTRVLKNNKATGLDQITAELLKQGENKHGDGISKILEQMLASRVCPRQIEERVIIKLKNGKYQEMQQMERHYTSLHSKKSLLHHPPQKADYNSGKYTVQRTSKVSLRTVMQ